MLGSAGRPGPLVREQGAAVREDRGGGPPPVPYTAAVPQVAGFPYAAGFPQAAGAHPLAELGAAS
ncbi:hypothetical protein TUE45_04243 [Streptomyces reticuli]|nr:hypothetical protein TUE45_04243 [Streptomyces reticuli]